MGIAKLYNQKQSGISINGIIEDYYAYAGENISAGDFVEFINGIASKTIETSADTAISETAHYGYAISACKLTNNTVFVAHSSDSYLYGIVCTINGATITYGTDTQLESNSGKDHPMSAVTLTNSKVFISFRQTTSHKLYGIVCTISGTAITKGTATQIGTTSDSGGYVNSTVALTTSKVFIAYCGDSSGSLYGVVCNISGTTVSKGTILNIDSNSYTGKQISVALLESTKVFIAHNRSSSFDYLTGIVCTISGTTITKGSNLDLSSATRSGAYMSAVALSSSSVFIAHSTSSDYTLNGIICTISGTTITKGTDTQLSTTTYSGYTISAELLENGKVFISHSKIKAFYCLYGIVCEVEGTTITCGTDTQLNGAEYAGITISSILLESGSVFIAHSFASSRYLHAQIWGVDETNNVPTNNVTTAQYETQVRKATTSDIYGVAKTKGVGGDSAGHKDIVSIYTIEVEEPDEPVVPDEPTYTYTDFASSPAPTTWTDSSDYLSATASNSYGEWRAEATKAASTRRASYAFDGSTDNHWGTEDMSTDAFVSCTIFLPEGMSIKPTNFSISYGQFKGVSIRGLNETTGNWDTIVSLTETSSNKYSPKPTTTTTDYYTAFRVYGRRYSSGYDQPRVHDFEITSGTLKIRD